MVPGVMTAEHGGGGGNAVDRWNVPRWSVINGAPKEAETTDYRGGVVGGFGATLVKEHGTDVSPGFRR